jgi:hypothetical protein
MGRQVFNNTGGTLTRGTLVYINGYSGITAADRPTVAKADADSSTTAAGYVVVQDIANNAVGYVAKAAQIGSMNTGGRTIGDAVYLSTTAGGIAFTAVGIGQRIGYVATVSATAGIIDFDVTDAVLAASGTSFSKTLSAAGEVVLATGTISHATANVQGFDTTLTASAQRTGGTASAYQAALEGFATDTSGTTYVAYDAVATPNGGSGLFTVIRADAGWSSFADLSSMATGEADIIVGANLADAFTYRTSALTYWTLSTTTATPGIAETFTQSATGTAHGITGTFSNATSTSTVVAATVTQTTNARTGGVASAFKATLNGFATDTSGGTYAALDAVATPNGGSGLFTVIRADAGWSSFADLSSMATGEADVIMGDNLASAFEFREGTNTYLKFVTTNSSESIAAEQRLTTTDGVASGTVRVIGGRAQTIIADVTHVDPAGAGDAAETVIQTYTIPANTIKASTNIFVDFAGICTVGATVETVVLRVRLGGVGGTIIAASTSLDPAANNVFSGRIWLTGHAAPGAAAEVAHSGWFKDMAAAGADSAIVQTGPTLTNFATNGALDLVFTVDFANAEAAGGDTIALRQWHVQGIG